MKFQRYFKAFSYRGSPVLVHWTVLLAFPFACLIEKSFLYALEVQVAFLVLMLAHELGHAFVAKRIGLPVFSLRLYAIHGTCIYGTPHSKRKEIAIAWGGVAAQAILFFLALALTEGLSATIGVPQYVSPILAVLVPMNMFIALFNLLPIKPLDGATAWLFIPLSISGAIARVRSRPKRRTTSHVVSMELGRFGRKQK